MWVGASDQGVDAPFVLVETINRPFSEQISDNLRRVWESDPLVMTHDWIIFSGMLPDMVLKARYKNGNDTLTAKEMGEYFSRWNLPIPPHVKDGKYTRYQAHLMSEKARKDAVSAGLIQNTKNGFVDKMLLATVNIGAGLITPTSIITMPVAPVSKFVGGIRRIEQAAKVNPSLLQSMGVQFGVNTLNNLAVNSSLNMGAELMSMDMSANDFNWKNYLSSTVVGSLSSAGLGTAISLFGRLSSRSRAANAGSGDGNANGKANIDGNPPPNDSNGGNPPPNDSSGGRNSSSNDSNGGNPPPNDSSGGRNSSSNDSNGGNPPPNDSNGGNPPPNDSNGGRNSSSNNSQSSSNSSSNDAHGGNPPPNDAHSTPSGDSARNTPNDSSGNPPNDSPGTPPSNTHENHATDATPSKTDAHDRVEVEQDTASAKADEAVALNEQATQKASEAQDLTSKESSQKSSQEHADTDVNPNSNQKIETNKANKEGVVSKESSAHDSLTEEAQGAQGSQDLEFTISSQAAVDYPHIYDLFVSSHPDKKSIAVSLRGFFASLQGQPVHIVEAKLRSLNTILSGVDKAGKLAQSGNSAATNLKALRAFLSKELKTSYIERQLVHAVNNGSIAPSEVGNVLVVYQHIMDSRVNASALRPKKAMMLAIDYIRKTSMPGYLWNFNFLENPHLVDVYINNSVTSKQIAIGLENLIRYCRNMPRHQGREVASKLNDVLRAISEGLDTVSIKHLSENGIRFENGDLVHSRVSEDMQVLVDAVLGGQVHRTQLGDVLLQFYKTIEKQQNLTQDFATQTMKGLVSQAQDMPSLGGHLLMLATENVRLDYLGISSIYKSFKQPMNVETNVKHELQQNALPFAQHSQSTEGARHQENALVEQAQGSTVGDGTKKQSHQTNMIGLRDTNSDAAVNDDGGKAALTQAARAQMRNTDKDAFWTQEIRLNNIGDMPSDIFEMAGALVGWRMQRMHVRGSLVEIKSMRIQGRMIHVLYEKLFA